MTTTTLILGIGNVLMSDEGVAAEVIRRLEAGTDPAAPWRLLEGGTLSFTLATPIAECQRLIVVDAATTGGEPGTLLVLEGEDMDRQLRTHAKSVHEVSLADLMDMARLTDSLPRHRAILGIQPERVDWGETLTPRVAAAVPDAIARIHELIERWDQET